MRYIWRAALVGLLGLAAGCKEPAPAARGEQRAYRVAMVLPGSDTDRGWNQMARESLDRMRTQLGVQTALATKVAVSEFATQLEYFAGEGNDVVICHGGEFMAAATAAAAKHPRTRFIVGGCAAEIPNAVPVEFLAHDASFLVGVAAGALSERKAAAFVGAVPARPVMACYEGMKDGLGGSDVRMLAPLWTDSWDSPTRAKEMTELAIANGADVIYQNVDAAAKGVFDAAADASTPAKPLFAFGCNSNQNELAPKVIVGSVVLDVQRAYVDLVREAREGKLKPGAVKLGLRGGYVDLVLSDSHPAVTPALRQKVNAARAALLGRDSAGK